LGVNDLENLDNLYYGYEDLYSAINNQVVTINNFLPDFGSLNLDISGRTSYSEAVFYLLKALAERLELDFVDLLAKTEIPTILLFGMEYKTRALASKQATAETFLAVGELLQMGARRVFVVEEKKSGAEVKNKNESVSKKNSVQTKTKKIEIKK